MGKYLPTWRIQCPWWHRYDIEEILGTANILFPELFLMPWNEVHINLALWKIENPVSLVFCIIIEFQEVLVMASLTNRAHCACMVCRLPDGMSCRRPLPRRFIIHSLHSWPPVTSSTTYSALIRILSLDTCPAHSSGWPRGRMFLTAIVLARQPCSLVSPVYHT